MLALSLIAALTGPECDALQRLRKDAHDRHMYQLCLHLIDASVECFRELHPADKPSPPGSLYGLCTRIDAGFHIASREETRSRQPRDYLDEYVDAGCWEDPFQRPRYYTSRASLRRRELDDQGALQLLREGELEAVVAWFRHWDVPKDRRESLVWSIANSMATRAEIAAELRRPDELRELVAGASRILDGVDPNRKDRKAAEVRNLLGWSILMADEAGIETEDPSEMLRVALEVFQKGPRANATKAASVQINLALAALQHGRADDADDWIGAVENWIREPASPAKSDAEEGGAVEDSLDHDQILMWLRILQIRRALADPELATRMDELERWQEDLEAISERGKVPLSGWYAQEAAGRRYEAMGLVDEAIVAYERAEEDLERYASSRREKDEAILAARRHPTFSRTSRRLVALRLDQGDEEGALRAVRAARTRALRIADAWRTESGSQPNSSSPQGDELRLVFFQISEVDEGGSREWAGFAMTAAGLEAKRIHPSALPEHLFLTSDDEVGRFAEELLLPFDAALEAAGSVEIVATGSLHHVPFHVLPWRENPLIHALPVTYSLDLGRVSAEGDPRRVSGAALVLHGNERDLADEAERVSEKITWTDAAPVTGRPDSADDLAERLAGASIAHFAVHGTRTVDRGLLRSDHRLHFGEGLEFSQERILEGGLAPALVYLSACQSSFADAETLSGGVGLTQAFLLRGAEHVIGAVDDIDEGVAKGFAVAFYGALEEEPEDVPGAWQRAFVGTLDELSPSQALQLQRLRLYTR